MSADSTLIKSIFLAAVEKASLEERAAFLEDACGQDEALRSRIDILLRAHEGPSGLPGIPDDEPSDEHRRSLAAAALQDDVDLSFLAPSSEPGSLGRLDHYEVFEVVGKGGTGVVLRAHDTKLMRIVALKVLAPTLATSGSARRRFVRESRASAAVRDDHVVAIHAVEAQGALPYLVMEFIDGCTLEALVRRNGPLDAKEVLRIGIQAAHGLAAAHRLGLIHRDVKPANILLENGVQRVKLTDFGLARAADDASLTQSGFIAGTPLYMAPEQANGDPIDARTDLFSLGSVLYELCAGRPAFRAANTVAVIKRVCEDAPRPLREINPDIPESLSRLIGRLLAKKPANRPASASDVAEQLAALLAGLHGLNKTPRSDRMARANRIGRTHRRLWAAAVLVVLLVGLGTGAAVRLWSPHGTLVLEVEDPLVSLTVDGNAMEIAGVGVKEIQLKPGQHRVEARKDGWVVREESITINRDQRHVVRIENETELSPVERWERSVAAMPAEQQVKAVVGRLKELNPSYDGSVSSAFDGNVVVELRITTDEINDISPLRALKGLKVLLCRGTDLHVGKLSDLTPLQGLPLKNLCIDNNPVADLSPLRGVSLDILSAHDTQVSDLSPLSKMRLNTLALQHTPITSLKPLAGMPIVWLDLAWDHKISDLSPLQGMPLGYLNLTELPISDISVLANMKSISVLILDAMPISDLSPLRGLPIRKLSIVNVGTGDFSPLANMPLATLRFDYRPDCKPFLKSFKSLALVNDKPIFDFWKEVGGK